MPELHPGRDAIRHFDRVLEQRPGKDDHELSVLTRRLGEFREELIDRCKHEGAASATRECLSHLNAVVSVAMGMHFPLGQPPWAEFEKARDWLAAVVERVEGLPST